MAFYTSGGRDETEKMLRDELERVKAALNEEHANVEFVQLKLQRDDLKSAFEQMNKEHEECKRDRDKARDDLHAKSLAVVDLTEQLYN